MSSFNASEIQQKQSDFVKATQQSGAESVEITIKFSGEAESSVRVKFPSQDQGKDFGFRPSEQE